MSAWWTGIPAAAATIECGGHTHTLRWHQGALTAVDHGDPEAEATLAALAGESVPCLDRVRAWNRRRNDVRVLTLASRGVTDPLHIDPDHPSHPRAPARPRSDTDLLHLLSLGGGLPDRLQAHAAAAWTRRLRTGHSTLEAARPQLHAALYGRALAALRTWLQEPGLLIELTIVDPAGERRLERAGDTIAVSLPFSWLTDVWARGLTTMFGRMCLGAETADGVTWTLDTLAPDLGDTTRLSITIT